MSKFDDKMNALISQWDVVGQVLSPPANQAEYDALVERMDALLDHLGEDEDHPLNGLLHLMGDLVTEYDSQHFSQIPEATGVEVLKHLMKAHGLKQSDLPEVGSQGVVSEILNGKRELNRRQIKALADRFDVPAGTFV
ncbi:helix-turn-helix domain-containing protein [Thiolapillus sp.]